MKNFLIGFAVLAFSFPILAADAPESIQDLRNEIAQLKASLAKAQEQSVANFATAVELRSKYEAAVQRIKEANDVARQWRFQAVNMKHELSYAKALAQNARGETTVDLVKAFAKSDVPQFRITNIAARAEKGDGIAMR